MNSIILQRKWATNNSTIGLLDVFGIKVYTLEDPYKEHKIWGETRIPAGTYELALRNEGGMTERYARRYPYMHEGMIWLQAVPYFEWVYIHVGNSPKDTNGCILVGVARGEDRIFESRSAYQLIYPEIVGAIKSEHGCSIQILDPVELKDENGGEW